MPANADIRAQGSPVGGRGNNASWLIESRTNSGPARPFIRPVNGSYRNGGNALQFSVTGPSGCTVLIEASSDMREWHPVATNQVLLEGFNFAPPPPMDTPSRFYRARLQ